MIYWIEMVKTDGVSHKRVHPVADREQLLALRDSAKNRQLLSQWRDGNQRAKTKLLQLVYNIGYAQDGQLLTYGC